MDISKLYPLKFTPIYKSRIWGGPRLRDTLGKAGAPADCGESWEISPMEGAESVVENGFLAGNNLRELTEIYMGDLVGDSVFDLYGEEFPLLVKIIDAHDDLSVQVHPGDRLAAERHGSRGKTECWYVVDAQPGARITTGLRKGATRRGVEAAMAAGTLGDLLATEPAAPGDFFFIPAGRVHAIGRGVTLVEVQQASDVTYRLYDYNRLDASGAPRQLHQRESLDAIDYDLAGKARHTPAPDQPLARLARCPHFTVNRIKADAPAARDYSLLDSFVVYVCVAGQCRVECDGAPGAEDLAAGQSLLIPAAADKARIIPHPSVTLIEAYIEADLAGAADGEE